MICPGCGAQIKPSQRLCTTCKADLRRYGNASPAVVAAYAAAGIADLERSLRLHAAFDVYCERNPR